MPPFSPAAKGFMANSMKLFWPSSPCQPSVVLPGGSTRPVERPVVPATLSPRTGGVRAVARARYPHVGQERVLFDAVRQAIRDAVRSGATEGVGGTAGVIDDVRADRLKARGVGFDYQPVQEREDFVEARIAVQVGVVEEPEAAVAIADVGRHQRQARLAGLRHAIAR